MIQSLLPKVTQAQAIILFRQRGFSGVFRSFLHGPLRSIADVYVPFRLFRVEIQNVSRQQVRWLALDAVQGTFDLYCFNQPPSTEQLQKVETRNHPPVELSVSRAEDIMVSRVRSTIFRKGFFRIRDLKISAKPVPMDLHIPYWVGFSGRGEAASVSVIDAVRRSFEGAKLHHFLQEWLLR